MIVIKIGGSLLTDSSGIEEVVNYIIDIRKRRPVIVVSALKGVTNLLIKTAKLAEKKDIPNVNRNFKSLKGKHLTVIKELINDKKTRARALEIILSLFSELDKILKTITNREKLSDRSLDYIMSFGEKLSSQIISNILIDKNIDSISVFSEKIIITNHDFGSASPIYRLTQKAIRKNALKWKNKIPIITGFIGCTEDGIITTLGRGGTDYSAAIIAHHLNAKEIWLIKDVEGVMTADRNMVSDAKVIPELSYEEAAELSYFGAKVIHPRTIDPLKKKNINMRIKSIENLNSPGTLVAKEANHQSSMKSISHVIRSCLIKVQGDSSIGVSTIASRIFSTVERHNVDILMLSQSFSENSVSFTIIESKSEIIIDALKKEFKEEIKKKNIEGIYARNNISLLSIIGKGINSNLKLFSKIYESFDKNSIHILASGNGTADLNISFLIYNQDLHKALNCIHKELNLGR